MRSLRSFDTTEEAYEALSILESRGIPAHVQEARGLKAGTIGATLFVKLDSQFDDALLLLEDPDHTVLSPVDMEEFRAFEQSFDHSLLVKRSLLFLAAAALLFGLVVAISFHT